MINKDFLKTLIVPAMAVAFNVTAQNAPGVLTVQKIMRDPKWIGSSPSDIEWGNDRKTIYFSWNPDNATDDSLYKITATNKTPQKVSLEERKQFIPEDQLKYNKSRTAATWAKDGDIFISIFREN